MPRVGGAVDRLPQRERAQDGGAPGPVGGQRHERVLLAHLGAVGVEALLRCGQDPQVGVVERRGQGVIGRRVVPVGHPHEVLDGADLRRGQTQWSQRGDGVRRAVRLVRARQRVRVVDGVVEPRREPGQAGLAVADLAGALEILQRPEHLHQVRRAVVAATGLGPPGQQVGTGAGHGVVVRVGGEGADVEGPPRDQGRHGAQSVTGRPVAMATQDRSCSGRSSPCRTVSSRDGAGEDDVEPAQPGARVRLGRGDGGRLHDDDPVELQALGHAGGHDVDLVLHVAVVGAEQAVLDPLAGQGR